MTVTVALPLPVIGQVAESLPDITEYVVVEAGETIKVRGLDPLCVPPPLFKVTVYGGVPPPVTVTVTVELPPAQIVPPPVTVPVSVGHTTHDEQMMPDNEMVSTRQFGLAFAVELSHAPCHRKMIF